MPNSTPLSYQTTMPEYPDVSYTAWTEAAGVNNPGWNRAGQAIAAWTRGFPSYETWRTNALDKYNAQMSAYNTWLSTGEGQRASLESGNYNPSYFDGQSASASPLNYQDVSPESGLTQMAQGVSGIFQFINALQGMRLVSEQITGQALKNEAQEIANKYTAENWQLRNNQLRALGFLAGYRADDAWYKTGSHLYSIFNTNRNAMDNDVFSPNGLGSYGLRFFKNSPEYQRAWADIALVRASKELRREQTNMTKWNAKERQWYVNNLQGIYRQFLEGQVKLINGQVDFQPIEQKLKKSAIQWGIGTNVANTALNAVKTVTGLLTHLPSAPSIPGVPSWGNMPGQSQSWSGGWDVDTGEFYGPWLNN